jgi:hypothetical protein
MAPSAPPALRLERMVRPPRRLLRRLMWAAAGAALAVQLLGRAPVADCRTATRMAARRLAAEVCEREYLRTRDPWTGARLADAQRLTGQLAVAGALAQGLLVSEARADALWVIGMIAVAEHRLDAARRALDDAQAIDRAEHRDVEAARDSRALASLSAAASSAGH